MTRLLSAAAFAALIAQPALAGGFSFDLPNLTFPGGVSAQAIMAGAPLVCVSTGSACSSAAASS